ncbi:ATP-grasp domain-containing protein [Mesorhizobium sp. M4B.F.Ca.ET.215.01.1.1]|uniref:lyase family protein n=1 Tax=unclassified Mesorhizobium TaxID=325217 RepID=UPI000FE7F118|nr:MULTISPECIES: lyase family protein [unclassified Mesorhizobium]RWC82885.1 MAG: ATP-grasp domain-containing protein [Mesorhizobium sp.]TGQ05200.1 ATP-grasp domain-containing protein [Mesorhizobium sp. M4B.F.Ca.ET.215.01.1.1]TGQ30506.1 ATP-grasp domain-containing protein [Mesorhizobium sp. M00.F.Ca.ET.220.01.1.1]TGQ97746.1 ATP-grasp domain-containing protein [Mesorhizobium sp. M4B.F.Ca.ET.203.01.1.1]TIV38380.1 MAG: ATP-grasp domain-containing protein [Mesorhizobium sp.]
MTNRGSFLFVESNTTGTGELLMTRARFLGFKPYLVTRNPARYPFLRDSAAEVIEAETRSPDELIGVAAKLKNLAGIYSSSDYFVEAAASLAAAIGLPTADSGAIATCRNKWQQAVELERASITIPKTRLATSVRDVENILTRATLPVVVKPVSGSGSSGVRLCNSATAAITAFESAKNVLLDQVDLPSPDILIQQYIPGKEYSAEIIAYDGTLHCLGILAKHKSPLPSFVEVGHDFPASLPEPSLKEVASFAARAVSALGLKFGPAHVEIVITESGPVIIEVNPRLAGGMIPVMLSHALGTSILDMVIGLYAGEGLAPPRASARAGAIRFQLAHRSGKLKRLGFSRNPEPTVPEVGLLKSEGDEVQINGDFRDRVAYAVGVADELNAAVAAAQRMIDSLVIDIETSVGESDNKQDPGSSDTRWTLHPEAMKLLAPPIEISRDGRLLRHQATIDEAHLVMLADQGLVSQAAAAELLKHILDLQDEGFQSLEGRDAPRGLYLAYEAELAARAGLEKAGWLHLARSRNDLNATISLLVLRETACSISQEIGIAQDALLQRAEEASRLVAPLYSQYQIALPGSPGHYLLGVFFALGRERQRLHSLLEDIRNCPMGAGAGGGTSMQIDPLKTASLLGFEEPSFNSLDAVASRDHHLHGLSIFASTSTLLSRVAQDLQVWTTRELALIDIPRNLAGGSSMLPQKKNPFLLEHIKGSASTVIGAYVSAATATSKAPFSNSIEASNYGCSPLRLSEEALTRAIILTSLIVKYMSFNIRSMREHLEDGSSMTAVAAERMASQGIPFREAHTQIGEIAQRLSQVSCATQRRSELASQLAGVFPASLEECRDALQFGGGPGKRSTDDQLSAAKMLYRDAQLKCADIRERGAIAEMHRKRRVKELIDKHRTA